jgi:uncharacterized protein (TIGR00730 family)
MISKNKIEIKCGYRNSYLKAYEDLNFLKSDAARAVRLQLEFLKPEAVLKAAGVRETIVCFGSARIKERNKALEKLKKAKEASLANPKNQKLHNALTEAQGLLGLSEYYDKAREFARLVVKKSSNRFAIVTGGGPGIMEAANRGASEAGGKSIGFNITLPMEQRPNPYVTDGLAFLFHYFSIRKMHLVAHTKALVVFPGGYGTFDEMFEALTLVQTGKKNKIPIIMVGRNFWNDIIKVDKIRDYGVISFGDEYNVVDTAREAWDIIAKKYKIS